MIFTQFSAWTAGLQVQALERHWQEFENTECGAELELSAMRVPFVMHEKKKKTYRKAIYAVARVGHQVKESELYIFTKVPFFQKIMLQQCF